MSSMHALPKIVSFPARHPVLAKQKRRRRLPWVLCCLCAVVAYFTYVYLVQEVEMSRLRHTEAGLRARVVVLEQESKELQREIALLSTDAYIERIARDRLGLILPQDRILGSGVVSPSNIWP